ncbi:MAG: DNA-3-methyladenine glycosylase I [Gemmatimonadetes bacterium]|nr:DNA-3-methyladenine glycosylase I [Gemmatimonadota bacterium]MBT8403353.1 DNA-3-methyladenine glycosylase I [Gemmatimonadota bacterium]NNK62867.1 DNA-3-methyladenine glycosylase I [Gemmatimonadota bacterium]
MTSPRCFWVPDGDALYRAYHDDEWGMPVGDDTRLFEKLSLEGFQAGLSWRTILGKRDEFRRAFAGFDIASVADFGGEDVGRLLGNAGIVRHRGKIEATIHNAARALDIIDEFGSLAAYFWRFEPEAETRPRHLTETVLRTMAVTPESRALSKDLRKRGWKFVGPTTVYAFMQAMGLVNDHEEGCAARARIEAARDAFDRPR